jgi:hypothetical protein
VLQVAVCIFLLVVVVVVVVLLYLLLLDDVDYGWGISSARAQLPV